jgi:hypothetical protein
VPYSLAINYDKAMRDEQFKKMVLENPKVFDPSFPDHVKQLALTVFLMSEWQKGPDSFWAPYIDYMPDYSYFCTWDESTISEVYDMTLVAHS